MTYAGALTCAQFDSVSREEDASYFTDIDGNVLDQYKERLIRKSVAAFHHRNYKPEMTLSEVDNDVGEGVAVNRVRTPEGREYVAVNVGFGGGNGATYYYEPDTLTFAGIMVVDGSDCMEQGGDTTFPIEDTVPVESTGRLTCTFGEGTPFEKVSVEIPLGADGLMFWDEGKVTFSDPKPMLRRLEIEPMAASVEEISAFKRKTGDYSVGFHVDVKGKKGPTAWQINLSARLRNNGGELFGKAFPVIRGGHWSKQAREFAVDGICEGDLGIKKVEYHRVVNF